MKVKEKASRYKVYGDDDQEQIETLEKMEDEIISLVDVATATIMKQRQKDLKKHRKIKDTTINRLSPLDDDSRDLTDIDAAISLADVDDGPLFVTPMETDVEEDVKEEKKRKKKEKAPKEKKGKGRKVFVLVIFFLIIVCTVVGVFWSDIYDLAKEYLPIGDSGSEVVTVGEDDTLTPTLESGSASTGLIAAYDADVDYFLSGTLDVVSDIEDTIYYYYTSYKRIVTNYDDSTDNIETLLSGLKTMVNDDITVIEGYEALFAAYGGGDYLEAVLSRYQNLATLISLASDGDSKTVTVNRTNEYIAIDNELAIISKDLLVAFIEANGGSVAVSDTSITYSLTGSVETEEADINEIEVIEETEEAEEAEIEDGGSDTVDETSSEE